MEWQIGEPPSAPPGPPVFPSGPVANLSVASPTSALRRLGAEAATFSPKERERVARQARLERAALESFSGELLLSEVGTYLAPAERKPPAGCCVPKDLDIDKLVTHVHTHTELYHRRTAREPTIFDEFMRTALEEACATYRGVYYTPEKMMQLPEGERIHLLLQSSDDHPDWWMLPDTDAAGYNHQDSTVEKMYGFDATLTEIKGSYVKARQHGQARCGAHGRGGIRACKDNALLPEAVQVRGWVSCTPGGARRRRRRLFPARTRRLHQSYHEWHARTARHSRGHA